MAHELPPLPYDYAALEPHIDEKTMHLHHDMHHAAYVKNLNAALEKYPNLQSKSAEELLRNLKTAEEKYLLYVNKREEARIGDALDERGILNVAIAEQPIVPAIPMQSEWSFGLMGLLLAGTASVGLGFAVDCLDPAFRTPDEVAYYLGAPVLASLPRGRSATA